MVKFGKRLCRTFANQQVESRPKLTDNSITTRNSLDPKLRKFGGLIGEGGSEKEVTHTSPSVMQISVWPVIRLQPGGVCSHGGHYDDQPSSSTIITWIPDIIPTSLSIFIRFFEISKSTLTNPSPLQKQHCALTGIVWLPCKVLIAASASWCDESFTNAQPGKRKREGKVSLIVVIRWEICMWKSSRWKRVRINI